MASWANNSFNINIISLHKYKDLRSQLFHKGAANFVCSLSQAGNFWLRDFIETHSVVCQSTRQRFFPCANKRQLNRSDNKSCPKRNVRVVKRNSMLVPLANVSKTGNIDYLHIQWLIMKLFGYTLTMKARSYKHYLKMVVF